MPDMPLRILVETIERLELVTARTQLVAFLVNLFKQTPPEIIDKVVYLVQGILWPDWKGMPNWELERKC